MLNAIGTIDMNAARPFAEPIDVIARETLVNVLIGIVISVLATWLLFRGKPLSAAFEKGGGVFGIAPATFNVTFLITLGMTLAARSQVRKGKIRRAFEAEGFAFARLLPQNVLLRALAFAVAVVLAFVPVTLLTVWGVMRAGLIPEQWPMLGFMIFYITYFTALTATITPVVLWRALQD